MDKQNNQLGLIIAAITFGSLVQFVLPILPIWLFPLITTFVIVVIQKTQPLRNGFLGGLVYGLVFVLVGYIGTFILPSTSPIIGGIVDEDVITGMIAFIPISGVLGLVSGWTAQKLGKTL